MRSLSVWFFCCFALAAPSPRAGAQDNPSLPLGAEADDRAVVITLAPGGDAPTEQRESALQALEHSVLGSDLRPLFVAALASKVGNKRVARCQESDCAVLAAKEEHAAAIAGVSVWEAGSSRMQTTLTITWRDLVEPNAEEQIVDIPLIGELTLEEAVASGVAKFLARGDDSIAVTIDSDPQGAATTIDGRPLGKTPLKVKLKPGGHELTLMLDERYQPARKAIMVAATSTRFEVPLEQKVALMTPSEPVDKPVEESSTVNPVLGTALMVVGAGMLAYGIYAFSVDGDSRVTREDGEQELKTVDSTGLGVGFAIAGGLSAAAGGLVFFSQPF